MKNRVLFGLLAIVAIIALVVTGVMDWGSGLMLAEIPVVAVGLKELREALGKSIEKRDALLKELQDIQSLVEKEKRELKPEEEKRAAEIEKELKHINRQMLIQENVVLKAEQEEERASIEAGQNYARRQKENEKKQLASYSFVEAIRSAMTGKREGLVEEMHKEAEKEARNAGKPLQGLGIPSIVTISEKRDLTVGVAGAGGNLVPDEFRGFIDVLKDTLVVKNLGAQFLTGLTSDVLIPRATGGATAAWEGENTEADETNPAFDQVSLQPKRLAAFTNISKKLIVQSAIDVENFVRNELLFGVQKALETAIINGTGASNQPTGILNIAGIGSIAMGENGGVPNYGTIIGLEKEVEIDNALMGALGYLTNPKVKAKLRLTKIDAGSGLFVWPQGVAELNGYRCGVTNLVPSNLTKGNGTDLSALIFGNFADLFVGQWGPLDLVVDPYTGAKTNLVTVIVNSLWDVAVRHAQSFAACKDMSTDITQE